MKTSESLKSIAPAIRRAQGAIHGVVANAANPFFKSKYADLEGCWAAVKEPLMKEGLSLVQTLGFIPGGGPTLVTTLLHESGEYISGEQLLCAKGENPQEMGSAITYARRYGLSAIIGLVEVDDDGEGAMKRTAGDPKQEGDLGAYTIKISQKLKGKRLDSCDTYELADFSKWLTNQPKLEGIGLETRDRIEAFLAARSPKKGNQ